MSCQLFIIDIHVFFPIFSSVIVKILLFYFSKIVSHFYSEVASFYASYKRRLFVKIQYILGSELEFCISVVYKCVISLSYTLAMIFFPQYIYAALRGFLFQIYLLNIFLSYLKNINFFLILFIL